MKDYTETIGGRVVHWRLERDNRLKKAHLMVHPQEGVVIRAPMRTPKSTIAKILRDKGTWLLEQIDNTSRQCPRRLYADGEVLTCLGQEVLLRVLWHKNPPRIEAHWVGREIKISLPSDYKSEARETTRNCLAELFKDRARQWFPPRVEMWNNRYFGYNISRVTIKGQARILGSCSSLGNLNFNWRLLLAPLEVVDYVIVHELAHMEEMNHSDKFWHVVERACPDYKLHRKWLKDWSAALYI